MSSNSDEGDSSGNDGSDSDYDSLAQCNSNTNVGTGVASGSGSAAPTSSRLNENQSEVEGSDNQNLVPSKPLAYYAKGTFDPNKPLLLYVTKLSAASPQLQGKKKGGTCRWTCNICSHTFSGSYSRVKQHLSAKK